MIRPRLSALVFLACLAGAGCGGGDAGGGRPTDGDPAGARVEQSSDGPGGSAREQEDPGGSSRSITQDAGGSSQSITQSGDGSSSVTQSSGSSSSSQSSSGGGGGLQTYSGSGESTLSFDVERPSRFAWTDVEGERFSVRGAGISIDSRSGRGERELEPGEYENVRVQGSNWTIVIRPR